MSTRVVHVGRRGYKSLLNNTKEGSRSERRTTPKVHRLALRKAFHLSRRYRVTVRIWLVRHTLFINTNSFYAAIIGDNKKFWAHPLVSKRSDCRSSIAQEGPDAKPEALYTSIEGNISDITSNQLVSAAYCQFPSRKKSRTLKSRNPN